MDTPKPRPDMLAASTQAGGGKRILAALEHGGKPPAGPARARAWTFDGWTMGLGLLLLLMLGAAWTMREDTSAQPAVKHSRGGAAPIAAAPVTAPPIGQAAAIVNEAPTPAEPAALVAVQAHPPRDVQAADRPMPAGSSATSRASHTAAARNTPPSSASAPASRGTAITTATAARDTDVTLLAALVAHANKPTVIVAERSLDVVERKEGHSTAQLLARCQQLGLIEGMLCRSRICADRWDADAACRAPAH